LEPLVNQGFSSFFYSSSVKDRIVFFLICSRNINLRIEENIGEQYKPDENPAKKNGRLLYNIV